MDFVGGSDSKESACNVGDLGLIPGYGRSPGGGHGNPLPYSCLENLHGQRSLEGYSPCGSKELYSTEWLNAAQYSMFHCMCSALSHVWLFATPWTVALQAPLSMQILQARILEWVAISFSRGSSRPKNWTPVSCIAGRFFTDWAIREAPFREDERKEVVK